MTTLYDLMFLVNDSTYVHIVDNENGDLLIEGEASDIDVDDEGYGECPVMDINVYENVLTICIEL